MKKPAEKLSLSDPRIIDPESFGIAQVAAIQALSKGIATPDQQTAALHFILVGVCKVDDEPYYPNSDRDTAYACGKRRVGTFVRSLIHADIKKFKNPDAAPTEQP